MTTEDRKTSRIVLALDSAGGRDFAFELARCVSLSAAPELLGLFVENVRLLEHAKSRLAREITFTGRERPLDRAAAERQLRAQSTHARARFEAAASRMGMPYTFRLARGEIGAELVRSAAEAEALVVSIPRESREAVAWLGAPLREIVEAPLPLVLLAREGWLSGRSIAVVVEDAASIEAALQTATRLAKESNSPITILLTGLASSQHERNRAHLAGVMRDRGIELGNVVALREHDARTIVQTARVCQARLVILTSSVPRRDVDLLEELLRRLPSALMLVRR